METQTSDYAWGALAVAMLALFTLNVGTAIWMLVVDQAFGVLVAVIPGLLFTWWIGMGAWRRTEWSKQR